MCPRIGSGVGIRTWCGGNFGDTCMSSHCAGDPINATTQSTYSANLNQTIFLYETCHISIIFHKFY